MNISIENFELKEVLIHCLIHNQLLTCQPTSDVADVYKIMLIRIFCFVRLTHVQLIS